MRLIARFVIVPLFLLICGCGSGNGNNGPMLTLTSGNWQVNTVSITNPGNRSVGGGSLNQTGTSVSGIMHLLSPPCFNFIDDMSVSGSVTGPALQLTSSAVNGKMLSVTATGSDKSLTGTYSTSGAACASADQGTFTAVLVPSATGTWQGNLTSVSGAVTQTNATLTQSGPDAHGFFSVTGTVTFNGSSCLASGTISGGEAIGATYVLIVTPNPTGSLASIVITGVMTDPATANAFSGQYHTTGSTCSESGSVSLNKS